MPFLNFVEYGNSSNQSLVIIHGLFGSHKNWSRISQKLAEHYYVIAVDCRNHGDSFNSVNMNYQLMANDVWLLVEHLELKKPIVMGHSMGGKTAMQLVSDHKDSFLQLVVVDIAPVDYKHDHSNLIKPILDLDITKVKNRKQVDEALKTDISDNFVRLFLLQSLSHQDQRWYWKIDWQNISDHMSDIVASPKFKDKISTPSLFVFGEKSEYYSPKGVNQINHYFNHADIEMVANGTHWLHYEQADEFMSILNRYLP